jgi:O-antigen/teichoic acid export membrane protein
LPGRPDLLASLASIGAQFVLTAAGYVTSVLLARALGPAAFGVFSLVYSLLLSVELLGRFGIPTATTRLLAGARDPVALCRSASGLTLVVSLPVFAVVWLAAPAAARLFGLSEGTRLLRLAAVDIPFFAFHLLLLAIVAGRGRFALAAALTCVYAIARLLGMFVVVLSWPTVEGALVANAAASLVAVLIGVIAVGVRALVPRLRDGGRLLSGASLVWIGNSLLSVLPQIGLWSVPILAAGEDGATVGLYAAALALARVPNMVSLGLGPLVLQRLAGAGARGETGAAGHYLGATMRFATVMLVPGCAVLAVEAEPVATLLFGPAYAGAAGVIGLLALGVGFGHSVLMLLRTALLAVGASAAATLLVLVAFAALALATGLLVPVAGSAGAALATALVLPAAALVAARLLARRVGDPLRGVPTIRLALLTALLTVSSWAIPGRGPMLLAELLLLGLLWLIAVWRLGLLSALAPEPVAGPAGVAGRRPVQT